MHLTDETRRNLRERIQETFTEQQLKDICIENSDTFRGNLYDLVEGNTYKSKLINLVRYLDQHNLINQFLKILGKENQNFGSQIESLMNPGNNKQNSDNIVSYLFFIIEPKSPKEFSIKAEFAQFKNNQCQQEVTRFPIQLSDEEECKSYEEKEIIDYVYKSIQEMKKELKNKNIMLDSSAIIELFVPISLLGKDFHIKKVTHYELGISQKKEICLLYPIIVRSYERFFKSDMNDELIVSYREKFRRLQDFINNTQELIESKDVYSLINDSFPKSKSKKRNEIFTQILREGFPLCLWTRYTDDNSNQINDYLQNIFNIDSSDCCKFYKILKNIYDFRKKHMGDKGNFGYNLGVLFDHDKIPTGANPLISPNVARNIS